MERVSMTAAQRARLRTFPYLLRALVPLTLLVVLAVVLAWPRGADTTRTTEIDPAAAIAQAQQRAPFALLAPPATGTGALGEDWRATSTRIDAGPSDADPFVFRIGYLTPRGQYAMYLQSNDATAAVLASVGPTTGSGSETIDGETWARTETSRRGEIVLTRTVGDTTLLVTGSASIAELSELAASLR